MRERFGSVGCWAALVLPLAMLERAKACHVLTNMPLVLTRTFSGFLARLFHDRPAILSYLVLTIPPDELHQFAHHVFLAIV